MTVAADLAVNPAPTAHDLRLVPAALTVWLGTLGGLLIGWWVTVAVGTGVAAAAAVAFVVIRRRAANSERIRALLLALLGFGAVLAVVVTPRLHNAQEDPIRPSADRGVHAVLRVTVTERPRPIRSAGYAGRAGGTSAVVIPADVAEAKVEGRMVRSNGRVVLIAALDGWSSLLPGQQVTASGSLDPGRPAELTVAALQVRGSPQATTEAPWWQQAAASMRAGLRKASGVLDEEPAGLLPGLAVGDTTGMSRRVEDEFRDAGLSHLNAVSGTNVTIVCGAVLLLLRLLRLGPMVSATGAGLALAGYLIITGPEPSVLRAGVMGAVGLLALALGRRGTALPALAAAVAGLVLYDPAMAASFGFALSVVATAGLVLLAPRWAAALARRGMPSGLAEWLAVPVAAFAVTAPIVAGMAGELSLVAVVANLLAAPVVAPATILGVLATVLGPVWHAGAEFLVRLAGPEASWLILVAREASAVPGAVLGWPSGWWGGLLAALVVGVLVVAGRFARVRLVIAAGLVVVLLVAVPARVIAPPWPPPGWAVVACDVGQGDAIVLATAEPGRAVVVDTGPEPGPVDRCLDRLGVDRVPLLVLSHLHADHVGGLESVFEGRTVGAVAVGAGRAPRWAWDKVAEVTGTHGVPLVELPLGQRLDWPGLSLDVLGPRYVTTRAAAEKDGTLINNSSLVLRGHTSAGRGLLTGDVELAAQADLLAAKEDLRADILKVPHHGSRYSLPDFLAAVNPRIAVVSVGGGNSYGHPHQSTVDNLGKGGALLTRTDTDGDTAIFPLDDNPAILRRGR
ncbi:ComEC/Rec2 family competence protein [Amycolatopsis magusensis]|uniref:ComEC/Rec2 family competence protein n=1 Tax=Amycolatopsis magusensis TaxID=882444 RepID=UPI0024A80D5B|nr:ComEC/Rec2 family competence protein [Amycolatopsis magusensis]MDI5978013.1 ComEC/Rec2 family competence protein [Amycolatopsis magusensis]